MAQPISIQFFFNSKTKTGLVDLKALRSAGLDVDIIPTSGPVALWANGCGTTGEIEVHFMVERILAIKKRGANYES